MKKFLSILLALTLILSLGVTAFAADIKTTDDHTYAVYQIFTGDLAEDGTTLSNIKWGANAKLPTDAEIGDLVPEEVLTELAAISNSTDDQAKLAVIEKYVDFTTSAVDMVTSADAANVVNGYYLLKDLGVSDGNGGFSVPEGQEYSEYVTKIVKDVTISPKKGETTTEKKVDDKNDTTGAEDEIVWHDSADHDIGDAVPFQLSAKITGTYDNYQTYYFAFHDEQSGGLTFDAESVEVFVDGNKITEGYSVVTTGLTDDCTFEIVFADLKTIEYTIPASTEGGEATTGKVHAGSVITVTYTSTLNDGAVIGPAGNPNTMYGEYSNNPNSEGTGTTSEDTVIVFTYEFDANKVAKNPNYDSTVEDSQEFLPLEGAGFTLYKQTGMTEAAEGATAEPVWTKIGDEITGKTTFSWKGLDDGTYKLVETTTPDGYNTMADVTFDITATHDTESATPKLLTLTCTEDDFDADIDTGLIDGDIENVKGTVLPETGGIGTQIFYILGGVLLVGAAILLITKKRMNVKN